MANLAGKRALVIESGGVPRSLADGVAAGLEESAAAVHRAAPGAAAKRVAAEEKVDIVVADLALLAAPATAPAAELLIALAAAAPEPRALAALAAARAAAGAVLLALRPASPGVTGRCVAALAMDPDIAEKRGGCFEVSELAREYRFTDPDQPEAG